MIITDNSFKIVSIHGSHRDRHRVQGKKATSSADAVRSYSYPRRHPHHVSPPRIRSISACLRPFHAFYCSSASKSFSYGRTNQRVLEASFPYFNRRGKKKGLRWPARPGLSSLSPDSFYRRLKTPRFAIQRKVVRSEDQNNAHDKHRPGKLEYFVKDAITRCCGWLSAYSSDYGPSTFQKKMSPPNSLCGKEWRCFSWLFPLILWCVCVPSPFGWHRVHI